MKKIIYLAIICIAFSNCKKNGAGEATPPAEVVITEKGVASGPLVTKTIDANGGELVSDDGLMKIKVAAGTVQSATQFSIQPITNTLDASGSTAYRLLPEGTTFSKPVTLEFKYDASGVTGDEESLLTMAFQEADRSWKRLPTSINKTTKTLTVQTTHFSDWVYSRLLSVSIDRKQLVAGEETSMNIYFYNSEDKYIRGVAEDDGKTAVSSIEWKIARGPGTIKPYGGSRTPIGATYKAPDKVTADADVVVTATVKGKIAFPDETAPGGQRVVGEMILIRNLKIVTAGILVNIGGTQITFESDQVEASLINGIVFISGRNNLGDVNIQINGDTLGQYPCGFLNDMGKADINFFKTADFTAYGTSFVACITQQPIRSSSPVVLEKLASFRGGLVKGHFYGTFFVQGNPCPQARTVHGVVEFSVPRSL